MPAALSDEPAGDCPGRKGRNSVYGRLFLSAGGAGLPARCNGMVGSNRPDDRGGGFAAALDS